MLMKHLVVYSHPNPKSFNHAILKHYTFRLKENGNEVRVRDLYALNFDPVLKATELAGFQKGKYPPDVRQEQKHLLWADMITFICPIWWGGLTSNLRGYMDRVLCLGFAYKYTDRGPVGMLKGKKIYLINTLGDSAERYEKEGYSSSMNKLLDEIAFQFCGIEVVGHKYFGSVGSVSDRERKAMLEDVKKIADRLK